MTVTEMEQPMNTTELQSKDSTAVALTNYVQLDTRDIFQNGVRQVEIVHGEARYSLRLTRENKLILTK